MNVYDQYVNPYDAILLNWSLYLELRDLHLHFLGEAKDVLDHGCGTGNQSVALLDRGTCVTAVDTHWPSLEVLVRKCGRAEGLRVCCMHIEALAFRDASFDAVTSMNVIYHLSDPATAFREAYRVARPGGLFLISGPLPWVDIPRFARDCFIPEFERKGLYEPNRELIQQVIQANEQLMVRATKHTAAEVIAIAKQVGFRDVVHATEEIYAKTGYFVAIRK